MTAATDAEHRPQNASRTTSPGAVTVTSRAMNSSGFSVFQNHSVAPGPAAADEASTCGRYQEGRASGPSGLPRNPRSPYAPSLMIVTGAGQPG